MEHVILIVLVAALIGFAIGFIFEKLKHETIGLLIINKSNPSKEFFEFHIKKDLDVIEKSKIVSFERIVR